MKRKSHRVENKVLFNNEASNAALTETYIKANLLSIQLKYEKVPKVFLCIQLK